MDCTSTKIYMLINPINDMPFYVGHTGNSLRERLVAHCGKCAASSIKEVVDTIKKLGMLPKIVLISEHNDNWPEGYYWEAFWIRRLKRWGFKLVNVTSGSTIKNRYHRTKYIKDVFTIMSAFYKAKEVKMKRLTA